MLVWILVIWRDVMFDPHLKDGRTVKVLDHGVLSADEREFIGKTGRIERAFVASCRVTFCGASVMLPKIALQLLEKR